MTKKTLKLEPISCPSCIAKIERALSRQDGVLESEVLFNSSKVNVSYNEELISIDQIKDVITNLGYVVKSVK
ncbi:MAG: heavy-metal-associated domain-containing protein [Bacilli bacterium]|jgi:copper chaperone CopZ|nr:heavy-metal-associated domain-containing protein [Bacilli bacterium]